MQNIRIIPRLDIKGPNLVKGIHLEGLRVLGNPHDFANYYYKNGADELIYVDVVASLFERNSLHKLISETAKNIFIPLTVGGGIRTIDDINTVLKAGADKVAINTAAIKNPAFLKEASQKFGSSTIVSAIEVGRNQSGEFALFTDNGRENTGILLDDWIIKVQELGAGEILLTSIDHEGTGNGFDIEIIKRIENKVSVPLIIHGGPGKISDIENMIDKTKIDAICISSLFHYHALEFFRTSSLANEGNTHFLKSGSTFSKINPCTIKEVKDLLKQKNIEVREYAE